jgi:hypothetical protein
MTAEQPPAPQNKEQPYEAGLRQSSRPSLNNALRIRQGVRKLQRLKSPEGRATAQAVSRWLPTAAARVRSCGICGGQSETGVGFLRVLRFPLPIFIPPAATQSPSSIICGW